MRPVFADTILFSNFTDFEKHKTMKKIAILAGLLMTTSLAFAQQIPSVKVQDLNGKQVNTADFSNDGKPMIINFWATWCKPCLKEMAAISDKYLD